MRSGTDPSSSERGKWMALFAAQSVLVLDLETPRNVSHQHADFARLHYWF